MRRGVVHSRGTGTAPSGIGRVTAISTSPLIRLLPALVTAQAVVGARVAWRLLRSAGGTAIELGGPNPTLPQMTGCISVIVPVLNEVDRLAACLDGLIAQGAEVAEILIVDGGSRDGTQELVRGYAARDARVLLIDASPVPADWNGKAWGLEVGLDRSDRRTLWLLTIDADVRPASGLCIALLDHAHMADLSALSIATTQEIDGFGEGLIHPAMLATLVYRFGGPNRVIRGVRQVQANGQCFMMTRESLAACGGFATTRASRCEDITLARALVRAGYPIGFFEAPRLVAVKMYMSWREAWRNWPRSLPMRDQFTPLSSLVGLCEVTLAQALPLPLFVLLWRVRGTPRWMVAVNGILALIRLGVLGGTARAYDRRPWSFWLSPLADLPVASRLWLSVVQRKHTWRGRVLVREGAA